MEGEFGFGAMGWRGEIDVAPGGVEVLLRPRRSHLRGLQLLRVRVRKLRLRGQQGVLQSLRRGRLGRNRLPQLQHQQLPRPGRRPRREVP